MTRTAYVICWPGFQTPDQGASDTSRIPRRLCDAFPGQQGTTGTTTPVRRRRLQFASHRSPDLTQRGSGRTGRASIPPGARSDIPVLTAARWNDGRITRNTCWDSADIRSQIGWQSHHPDVRLLPTLTTTPKDWPWN